MTDTAVSREELLVTDLDLDCENPRHGQVASQRMALVRLIADQRDKIVRIAVDIHDHGLSPAQLFIVTPDTAGRFIVLDGNRRLAALRILDDPTLLPADLRSAAFTRATAEPGIHPSAVMCAVVPNRDAARLWLDRTHSGQMSGVGTIPWSSAAKHRFSPNPSVQGHTASAITVLDWLRQRLEADDPARAHLDTVETNSVTNLGRLAADPDVRGLIGFGFQSGTVALNDDASAVIRRLLKIIEDLAGGTTVTQLKKKPDRAEYVTGLLLQDTYETRESSSHDAQDDSDGATDESQGDSSASGGGDGTSADDTSKKTQQSQTPAHPFADIDMAPLHPRIQQIMAEVRKLNHDNFPNATAVLLRAIIELTVTEFLHCKGSTPGQDKKLPTRIREAMKTLGIPGSDPQFQPLHTKLKEQHSIISVPNLHQYVHNVNAVPGRSDLNSIAFAYRPLLERICSDLKAQQATTT